MTEVDEQGFVRDIKVTVDAISQENKSLREKIKEIIELPYSVQDVIDIENYVNSVTNGQVDVGDEIYQLAIINEQLNGFDVVFKSKLEERHKELVEALMNRMEGVFKMYDVNEVENVQTASPVVEQPVVQTPQLTEINPETPVEEVTVDQPVATLDAPDMFTPVVDPAAYAEPTVSQTEVATDVPPVYVGPESPLADLTAEVVTKPVAEVQPEVTDSVPSFQEDNNEFKGLQLLVGKEDVKEIDNGTPSFQDFLNNTDFSNLEQQYAIPEAEEEQAKEEKVEESQELQNFDDFVKALPEEPAQEANEEYEVPEETTEPVAEDSDEDEKVREISERYDTLKVLSINVYKNQKRLERLVEEQQQVQAEIDNDQEKIASLRAA